MCCVPPGLTLLFSSCGTEDRGRMVWGWGRDDQRCHPAVHPTYQGTCRLGWSFSFCSLVLDFISALYPAFTYLNHCSSMLMLHSNWCHTRFRRLSLQISQAPLLSFDMSIDLCQVPAGPPPEGATSNFENPTTLIPAFMSLAGITVAVAIIFTVARLCANFRKLALADCQFRVPRTSYLFVAL